MPDDQGRLFASECAARAGMSPSDWRARVSRGHAPAADDHVVVGGAVRAVWDPAVFSGYLTARQQRLAVDHPHADPGDGRTECDLCGKFVWPVTHSCKRVPVTPAAIARYNAGRPPEQQITDVRHGM